MVRLLVAPRAISLLGENAFVADKLVEVEPELLDAFLGGRRGDAAGAALLPGDASVRPIPPFAVLFTDVVDSTFFTQQLGDERALELLTIHDAVVRGALAANKGREVKHTGDGIMACFVSAAGVRMCDSDSARTRAPRARRLADQCADRHLPGGRFAVSRSGERFADGLRQGGAGSRGRVGGRIVRGMTRAAVARRNYA